MKKLYITAASAAMIAAFTSPTLAGNINIPFDDPHVAAPVQSFSWSGPYAGVSAGATRHKETRPVYGRTDPETRPYNKLDLGNAIQENGGCEGFDKAFTIERGDFSFPVKCSYLASHNVNVDWANYTVKGFDPVVTKEGERFRKGTVSSSETNATYGGFAGYRHQWNSDIVLGGELAAYYVDGGDTAFEATGHAGYALGRLLPYVKAGYDFTAESAVYGAGVDLAIGERWAIGADYTHIERTGDDRATVRAILRF